MQTTDKTLREAVTEYFAKSDQDYANQSYVPIAAYRSVQAKLVAAREEARIHLGHAAIAEANYIGAHRERKVWRIVLGALALAFVLADAWGFLVWAAK